MTCPCKRCSAVKEIKNEFSIPYFGLEELRELLLIAAEMGNAKEVENISAEISKRPNSRILRKEILLAALQKAIDCLQLKSITTLLIAFGRKCPFSSSQLKFSPENFYLIPLLLRVGLNIDDNLSTLIMAAEEKSKSEGHIGTEGDAKKEESEESEDLLAHLERVEDQ